ncbi:MAG: Crp/Fnr family transcriptional regulator [Gammaproteobacteria bacterium]|nr:Crp/Fnr family transcriptional regulator [Gammaproteobacteria bacterium]MDH5653743.1 Crp/Fnr family transcriptional regulator [Gammaproteobacteria bacterium]
MTAHPGIVHSGVQAATIDHSKLKALLSDYHALTENADQACWDMLAGAKLQTFPADTAIFHEGMECNHLMLIVEGCVRVYRHSDEGREVTLYRVEPGQLCIHSLNNLVDGVQSRISVKTETAMRGLVINRVAFQTALDQSTSFRNYVLRTLTERLSLLTNLVSGFAFDRLDLRVACWLVEQFDRSCGHPIQVTHSDIAHELGTTREMISRILKDFEHKRCIQLARGRIHLVCKHSLSLASQGKGKVNI